MPESKVSVPKADVYFNLHRKVWSVKDRTTGKVVEHVRGLVFNFPCQFVVSEAGRQRVLAEQRKNVHAFVRGPDPLMFQRAPFISFWERIIRECRLIPVSYNPYKGPSFFRKTDGEPINRAESVVMLAKEGAPPEVWALSSKWIEGA